jgi:succinyl-diaminopimelate desuccinylase
MVSFSRVARKIDDLAGQCIDFLVKICSIPALGPENLGTGEMDKYRVTSQFLQEQGPDKFEEVHAPDQRVPEGVRPNLLAIFKGSDTSRTLWILTHIDIVPPGELKLWGSDPFKPHVHDGHLYGRGVEDNGQSLAASIYAVRAVKETIGLGLNVGLAIVSDEETGSRFGLDYVLRRRPDFFQPDDLIVVPDAGSQDGDLIEIAEKHLLHVKLVVRGNQGHASRPDMTRNSLRAAAHFIVELDRELPARFNQRNAFFNPPVSTFEPTRKDANVPNINTIPGEDVFFFDCRVLPEVDLNLVLEQMGQVAKQIGDQFGVEVSVEEYLRFDAPEPTSQDSPVVVALAQAIQEVYGVQARPNGIGGQTVAAFFRKRGLRAAVWEKVLQTAHAPNERISLENLVGNTKVFARMMIG